LAIMGLELGQDFMSEKWHSTSWAISLAPFSAPVSIGIFIPSFLGATSIGVHCKWQWFPTWVAWARAHCFFNEERVWSSRSIISFHANSKVWITQIKPWMHLSGHQYSCPDVF
jgi:hypothetical protein